MKYLSFILLLLFFCSLAESGQVVYSETYDNISRRGGEPGGSTFTQEIAPVLTDAIKVTSISGRIELEYVRLLIRSGNAVEEVSFAELLDMDSGNLAAFGNEGFVNSDPNSNEPNSIELYLNDTYMVEAYEIAAESYSNGAIMNLSLVNKSGTTGPVDPSEPPRPIPPPEPQPVDPVEPPPPQCDLVERNELVYQCKDRLVEARVELQSLDRAVESLRRDVEAQNSELLSCRENERAGERDLSRLNSDIASIPRSIRATQEQTRRLEQSIRDLDNPPTRYNCYVIRGDGRRFPGSGTNRAQVLQDLMRQCMVTGDKACGYKWKPNEKNRWGCERAN